MRANIMGNGDYQTQRSRTKTPCSYLRFLAVYSVVIIFILIICIGGLCVPAFVAKWGRDLLLVFPIEINLLKIDINRIEDFIEGEFLLTYEIPGSDRVSLSTGECMVTLIGTNSCYSRVLGLPMIEGSFFSARDWEGKQRQAVLNEKAAFDLFGSSHVAGNRFKIRNETWLVAGVINDRDEDRCRIYVPSSLKGGGADAFLALISGGIDEAYVRNSLKILGIQEAAYNFFNFGTITDLLWERAIVISLLLFALLFLSLLKPLAYKFKAAFAVLREGLEHNYIGQIIKENRKSILKPALYAMGLAFFPVLALFLFLRIASICLHWQDIPSLALIKRELFYPHPERLCNYEFASRVLFFVSLAVVGFLIAGINILLNKNGNG